MIISPEFVWIHIGRTGGYLVDSLIRDLKIEAIELDPIGGIWSDWKRHESIEARSAEKGVDLYNNRMSISNIRRLPNWIVAFAEYKLQRSQLYYTNYELSRALLKAELREPKTGQLVPDRFRTFNPDDLLLHYSYEKIETWWRTEHLVQDCISTLKKWYEIPEGLENKWTSTQVNSISYNRNVLERFSKAEIEGMYEKCPLWRDLELKVFGNLMV